MFLNSKQTHKKQITSRHHIEKSFIMTFDMSLTTNLEIFYKTILLKIQPEISANFSEV